MTRPVKILLIDDDEDSYVLTRRLLHSVEGRPVELEWVPTYEQGLEAIGRDEHDVYLVDYRLGARHGLDLVRKAVAGGSRAPMVMMTGMQNRDIDTQAMQAGAADYIVKDTLDAPGLERSIRHALERHRLHQTLRDRATRLHALASELSQAEQRERSRVARLLHDHLQQILVGIKMHVEALGKDNSPRQISNVLDLVNQVFEVSRTLSAELSPPILMDAGLAPALAWLQRWMATKYNLKVTAQIDPEAEPAAESVRFTIFHAVRELLTNIARHTNADEVDMSMNTDGNRLRITLGVHGRGLDAQAMRVSRSHDDSFDIVHLHERLKLIEGNLELSSTDSGCQIVVTAPRRPFDAARTALA